MNPTKVLVGAAVVIVIVFACSFVLSDSYKGTDDEPDRIGVIGAMDTEVGLLKDHMTVEYTKKIADMEFLVGTMGDTDVVIVQCGIGKVNAGICAQLLISQFNVDRIINTGVAGSLSDELDIGDFVVSTDAVQHDFDETPIGYQKGEIPYIDLYSFKADDTLRQKAMEAIAEVAPEVKALEGRVCTGDQFIASVEQKTAITDVFGGLCCEMEGGAIAQVCYLNDVPFVIIRAISDNADGTSSVDYVEFEAISGKRSAEVVEYLLKNI